MGVELLKRRLNPFLLVAAVVALLFLAGLSVVYQEELSTIVAEKKVLQDTIDRKEDTIQELEAENRNLSEKLSGTESDLQRYIQSNQRLQGRIQSLQDTINQKEQTITQREQTISQLEADVDALEQDLAIKNATVNSLEEDVADLDGWLDTVCGSPANNFTDSEADACDSYEDWQ